MARSVLAVVALLVMAHAASAKFPPLSLPSFQLPNVTEYLEATKTELRAVAQSVVMAQVAVHPIKCPNGKPLVTCLWNVCEGKCNSTAMCLPDYCGSCGHKCIALSVPNFDVKVPKLPSFDLKFPNISIIPKLPCGQNEAINVTATASSLFAKNPKIACKTCPAGTVSKPLSLSCTLCPPGTYADREKGTCTKCAPGTYAKELGATACKACPANTMAPISGSFGCIPCPLGFKAAEEGSAKCSFVGF